MLDCLIIGDSIAVGTHQFRPECVSYAKVGITSKHWNNRYIDKIDRANTAAISLGSNDYRGVNTALELGRIREKIGPARVYWILPAINPEVQSTIRTIAAQYGDTVVPITKLSPDKVHPTQSGYKELAERTK